MFKPTLNFKVNSTLKYESVIFKMFMNIFKTSELNSCKIYFYYNFELKLFL